MNPQQIWRVSHWTSGRIRLACLIAGPTDEREALDGVVQHWADQGLTDLRLVRRERLGLRTTDLDKPWEIKVMQGPTDKQWARIRQSK